MQKPAVSLTFTCMPQGDKSSYTDKQKRQAEHIEAGYEKKGVSTKIAEARAWATVNKLSGGGKKAVLAGSDPDSILLRLR
ncbi:MAG: hypothetical protein WCO56_04385 [Verrucomicrobiota bacterium]